MISFEKSRSRNAGIWESRLKQWELNLYSDFWMPELPDHYAKYNWWMGWRLSFTAQSHCPLATLEASVLSVISSDHRHLPQSILLLKGMLSRNTGLKKVKFARSCYVLSVPLSISGIKCLLLGVRFCTCIAPNCQHNPTRRSLSLRWLVPPLYLFPTPPTSVSSLFDVEWISTKEITDKKYTLPPSKVQRRNRLPDVSIQLASGNSQRLGTDYILPQIF